MAQVPRARSQAATSDDEMPEPPAAAKDLKIHRNTLGKKIEEYNL